MLRTDLRAYYPSIPFGLLTVALIELGADLEATASFIDRVETRQKGDGVVGLPIGAEACAIPGTAFLAPVDDVVASVTDSLLFG